MVHPITSCQHESIYMHKGSRTTVLFSFYNADLDFFTYFLFIYTSVSMNIMNTLITVC